eukprot:TRINITY_DN671_c0_g1_i1.p1 TRINITY_DN671_c0_g1~~TRINITY_DN671_c0_g1_i1.p1  ORF type:complete len:360 (+),score=141.18 TRINITY_DN671_c0_g1_i1:74-1153(+)
MADDAEVKDETIAGAFELTKKKKKKKKERKPEEEEEGVGAVATEPAATEGSAKEAADVAAVTEEVKNLSVSGDGGEASESLFLGKKKKKKKPADGDQAAAEGGEKPVAEPQAAVDGDGRAAAEEEEAGDAEAMAEGGDGIGLLMKKKKKKKDRVVEEEPVVEEQQVEDEGPEPELLEDDVDDDEEASPIELGPARFPWEGLDRDYLYDELLGRVFNILRENNPELAGEKRRTVMRPPQVLREGTKKTVFANFMDLCKTMHRQPEHVMAFLLAELGTSGSLDGQSRLIVKGRFAPKNFEGILRRYVNEYVMCSGCKSPDTILSKENRLFFLRCEQCGSGRSVAPIKAGFVARVGRRRTTT